MEHRKRIGKGLLLLIIILGLVLPNLVMAEIYEETANNFIILCDTSSSMNEEYMDTNRTKLYLSKIAMRKINNEIPSSLNYTAGIYSFTPFEAIEEAKPFDQTSFGNTIETLPEMHSYNGLFSSNTPLARGIRKLDNVLNDLSGKTVVFLISDGEHSDSDNPVREVARLHQKHNVCFSIISLAGKESGNHLLSDIASLSQCSKVSPVALLTMDDNLVEDEIYMVKAQPVVLEPEAYSPPDSDGDGVADNMDKCRNTRMGYIVDAYGCNVIEPSVINSAVFDSGKADITAEYKEELDKLGIYLSDHPEAAVFISGHTDSTGSKSFNMKLSQTRAETAHTYLTENFNINEENVTVKWFGEEQPVASNETKEGRKQNRAVQIRVEDAYKKK